MEICHLLSEICHLLSLFAYLTDSLRVSFCASYIKQMQRMNVEDF